MLAKYLVPRLLVLIVALLLAATLAVATPAALSAQGETGEWIWFPGGNGGWVYCDWFPDQYGQSKYYCWGLKGEFWVPAVYGWQYLPPGG